MLGFGNLGRRLFEGVVGVFALLGFLYVPLGKHTGFEHAKAILSTKAATSAFQELTATALGLRERALDFISTRLNHEALPEPATRQGPLGGSPRPVPPKLK